jgi:high-affinity nickel permease
MEKSCDFKLGCKGSMGVGLLISMGITFVLVLLTVCCLEALREVTKKRFGNKQLYQLGACIGTGTAIWIVISFM